MAKLLNNKWVFTDDEIDKQIDRGKKLFEIARKDKPVATSFKFHPASRILSIRSNDGTRIDFPIAKIKELQHASDKEIRNGYITKSGDAIHWDELNAHYTVAGLAANIFGTKEWMRELARIGGSQTSMAKGNAARLNGLKGGRPPASEARPGLLFPSSRSALAGHTKNATSKTPSSAKSKATRVTGSAKSPSRKK